MRTTVYLPDDLLAQAKKVAAKSQTTLTALIEDALRERLGRKRGSRFSQPVRLTTYGSAGTVPGVNLDDSASLLDMMEHPDDPPGR